MNQHAIITPLHKQYIIKLATHSIVSVIGRIGGAGGRWHLTAWQG